MASENRRTSDILSEIIGNLGDGSITLEYFITLLGDRAFALVILIFALPNALPLPGIPGLSTVTGLPIAFFALQLIAGRGRIWLPQRVAAKRVSQNVIKRMLTKALPAVRWLERYICPRWEWACTPFAHRVQGVVFLVLALVIALPIPGGNFLPGLSMALIALGLLEEDGLFVTCALGFALLSLALMWKFIALFVKSVTKVILALF